jgi:hypothetical protein
MSHRTRLGIACLVAALAGSLGLRADSQPRSLRLLQRIPVPQTDSVATDIRWAGEDSVYVSWDRAGVAEVGLDGTRRRALVPDVKTLGGVSNYTHYNHLAVSSQTLATASLVATLVWRPVKANPGGPVLFRRKEIPITHDFDLSGDRLLLMGLARFENGDFAPDGAVAWIGTTSSDLADLKPVLHDVGGPGAPSFFNCRARSLGAVRFLGDSSFVIAPGFQDGILLFGANGQRLRSWTNEQVGLDTHKDCSRMSREEETKWRAVDSYWQQWLNRHHVLDDVLPLPQGPGLLVRSWEGDNQAHWTLKVLGPGGIQTYAVPVTGRRPFDRLHGDVRNGRIVLLLSASGLAHSRAQSDLPAEISLMELPNV